LESWRVQFQLPASRCLEKSSKHGWKITLVRWFSNFPFTSGISSHLFDDTGTVPCNALRLLASVSFFKCRE
jgi:hypothetical protein